jgi:virulence factor Mce-like protein
MITRRVLVNLGVFLAVAVVLVFFGFMNLLGNPFAHRTSLRAVFPDASGLSPNFDVTYDGVAVGAVTGVQLVPNGAEVTMRLDPGRAVPDDVRASVDLANALGEQQVDLVPTRPGPAPDLRSGSTVPVDPTGVPASVGQLVSVATKLLNAIPVGDLNSLLSQLALALQGNGQNLRTITTESQVFAQEFLHYQSQFKALLASAPPVLNAVASVGPQLRNALADTAVLAQVLANRKADLANLITQGAVVSGNLQNVVSAELPNLACLTHDFADLNVNLAQPTNLSNLNATLLTNQYFFGAVDAVSPSGKAVSLYPGDPVRTEQEWLRTRLLLPPASPPGSQYSQDKNLPPTKPGAACETEFGPGVGAATQAHPSPVGPGGSVIQPTANEAVVRGGQPTATGETAVARLTLPPGHAGSERGWVLVVGPVVVALAGLWLALGVPVDPTRRGRRPLRRSR